MKTLSMNTSNTISPLQQILGWMLNAPKWPRAMHGRSDVASVASVNALYYSQASAMAPSPGNSIHLTGGRRAAARLLRGWRIDSEHFGTFLVFSGIQPRRQPMPSPERYNCQTARAKSETPTGGTLYVCEMQPFPRRLMKRRVGKYTAVIKGDTGFCFLQ